MTLSRAVRLFPVGLHRVQGNVPELDSAITGVV